MFAELLPAIDEVIVTRSFYPRAAEAPALTDEARRLGYMVTVVPAVENALAEALRRQTADDLVLVTGSIFVAAGARQTWYNLMKAA